MNDFSAEYDAILSMRTEGELISLSKGEYKKRGSELSAPAKKSLRLIVGPRYADELTKAGRPEVEVLELLLEREDKRLSEWRQTMDKIRSGVDGKS